jgi:putative transposase
MVSEKMIGSMMRELGLVARKKRPYRPKTTQTGRFNKSVSNLLKDHNYTGPNQCLVGDITYIKTKEGWLYLAGFMDIYSRMIKGYHLSDKMPTSLVLKALNNALHSYPALKGAVVHSDRGCQYTSHSYQQKLSKFELKISMGAKGYCYDNAAVESFWSTLKTECFPESGVFETKAAAKAAIFECLETYYNTQRLHSGLNYTSPLAAERVA